MIPGSRARLLGSQMAKHRFLLALYIVTTIGGFLWLTGYILYVVVYPLTMEERVVLVSEKGMVRAQWTWTEAGQWTNACIVLGRAVDIRQIIRWHEPKDWLVWVAPPKGMTIGRGAWPLNSGFSKRAEKFVQAARQGQSAVLEIRAYIEPTSKQVWLPLVMMLLGSMGILLNPCRKRVCLR
jgi:hypothetical protein